MLKLIVKILILLIPVEIILISYLVFDPFEVLRHYDKHYNDSIVYNWDYNQTEILLTNYPKYNYDSFIFGNSRSRSFVCSDWGKYISSNKIFHYDASDESLYGIYYKIAFLQKKGIIIKNALMIIDAGVLPVVSNSRGYLFIKHPEVSGQSWLNFHLEFISAYFNKQFLINYLHHRASKITLMTAKGTSSGAAQKNNYDSVTGDYYASQEEEIDKDASLYYNKHKGEFYTRVTSKLKYNEVSINRVGIAYLSKIREIFNKHKTNYKIIISPLFNQIKIHPDDLNCLNAIFGSKNVFDYSGVNVITNDIHNYFDESHYRRLVGKQILDNIYNRN